MITKEILSNGLTILTERMPHVRSVAMGIWLKRGTRHERAGEGGIAHFIEHMVFKGTERRSQLQIAQELDAIGGHSDAFTTQEYAGFHAKVLDEHLPQVTDLLADVLLHPSFDPDELERERKVIFEEIKMVEDAPDELAYEIFVESFWRNHPLGRPILGTSETVEAFRREDLIRFFRSTYVPGNLIVAAAGNLEHERTVDLVGQYFGSLPPLTDPVDEYPPLVQPDICYREKDLEQVHLVIGTVAPPESHEDRFALYVLNSVLGGTMSSRLFQVIREKSGLAYSVSSTLTCYRDAGNLTIYAGTSPRTASRVVELVLHELRRIKQHPVHSDELTRAKEHLRGSMLLSLEGTGSRMSELARREMYFGRQVPLEEELDGIDRVTAEDVLRLATEMFDRPLGLTAIGNLEYLRPVPEKLVA